MKMQFSPTLTLLLFLTIFWAGCKMPEGPVSLSGEAPEAEGWAMETVLDGLEHPWAVAWLPDGSMLITERPGRLRLVTDGILHPDPIGGVPTVYADGQGGLLDVALHPNFESNRTIYLSFAEGNEDRNRTAVARAIYHNHQLHDVQVIFRAEPAKSDNQHFGSRLAWLNDGTLLVTIGDGGNRPQSIDGTLSREFAQKMDSHLGKIVRIHTDGTPPEDNPFIDHDDAKPEIWSLGHRNIQGITVEPGTGQVWANEHGSRGGDELNLLEPGQNYGWPEVTYSREYYGPRISRETSKPGMVDPKVVWTPAQAPSGLTFYTGDVFPEWQGDLFSGGLRGEQVRRIMLDDTTVTGEESLTIGRRVRDVRQGPDGYLYILTDEENGRLIKIVPEGDR